MFCSHMHMQAAKVAEARRRHWATAGPVLIEPDVQFWSITQNSVGSNSDIVNGAFEVAERPDNEPPIYRRADGSDGWLYVNKDGDWMMSDKEDKDAHKTSLEGTAHSVEAAEGRLPHEVGAAWKALDSGEWTEQQLRVLHGEEAEAAIAEVCVYAWPHACMHAHTGTLAFSRRGSAQPYGSPNI
jgi:hypothetical protein